MEQAVCCNQSGTTLSSHTLVIVISSDERYDITGEYCHSLRGK